MPATTKQTAKIFQRALQLNTQPTVIMENHHNGCLPLTYEGMKLDKDNVVVSAFKKAEDGNGYILRAYECDGKAVATKIDCKNLGVYTVDFAPYEIKTIRIHNGAITEELFTEYTE